MYAQQTPYQQPQTPYQQPPQQQLSPPPQQQFYSPQAAAGGRPACKCRDEFGNPCFKDVAQTKSGANAGRWYEACPKKKPNSCPGTFRFLNGPPPGQQQQQQQQQSPPPQQYSHQYLSQPPAPVEYDDGAPFTPAAKRQRADEPDSDTASELSQIKYLTLLLLSQRIEQLESTNEHLLAMEATIVELGKQSEEQSKQIRKLEQLSSKQASEVSKVVLTKN